MNPTRNSNRIPSQSGDRNPVRRKRRKQRNVLLMILLALLPVLVISGLALSAYLTRPPELPPINDGKASGVNVGTTEGTTEETTDKTGGTPGASEGNDDQGTPVKAAKQYKENFYTFLVTGTDYEGYHTDTIMVISFDTAAHKVNIVSVPRDTMIDTPRESKKINAAYAYGGTSELKSGLQSILGFAPQYYIRIDLEAFAKVVDAVGGVEYDVPQDMNMDDDAQDLHIHLVKGQQVLDGDKALQLVRFRGYPSADLGRMQTQQKFLKALARKALSPINLIKLNTFINIFQEDIKTDIGLRDLQWFAQQAIKVNPETDITVQTLPLSDTGNYQGQNYLFLSLHDVIEMVNKTINPYTTDITEDDLNIIRMEDSAYGEMAFEEMRVKEALKLQ